MTPISEKLLKEGGWIALNLNWIKNGKTLYNSEGNWRVSGKTIKYMEQLENNGLVERKFMPSFSELTDRLNIVIQKIAFAENETMKAAFVEERDNIIHDINIFLSEGVKVTGEMISVICALQFINYAIWSNEAGGRGDGETKNYELTHGLNANRAECKKRISQLANGRIDHKLNYIKGAWDLKL